LGSIGSSRSRYHRARRERFVAIFGVELFVAAFVDAELFAAAFFDAELLAAEAVRAGVHAAEAVYSSVHAAEAVYSSVHAAEAIYSGLHAAEAGDADVLRPDALDAARAQWFYRNERDPHAARARRSAREFRAEAAGQHLVVTETGRRFRVDFAALGAKHAHLHAAAGHSADVEFHQPQAERELVLETRHAQSGAEGAEPFFVADPDRHARWFRVDGARLRAAAHAAGHDVQHHRRHG
jgi:hypothetical protein